MRDDALEPVRLPDQVWDRPETRAALRDRRIGYLFGLARKYAGASQTRIANVTGMDQGQVSRMIQGDRRVTAIQVLERVARGFTMPDQARVLLGLAPESLPDGGDAGMEPAGPGLAAGQDAGPSRRPRRLPIPLTELIGRDAEIAAVEGLLATRRLVTLVGAPGIGKTRLALEVAEAMGDRFGDGAVFVSLAEAASRDEVVAALARALRVTEAAGQLLIDGVAARLAGRRLLLVLDNFEQVLDAAPLVGTLAAEAPGLSVLVTSRERLRVSGEQLYVVPPLTLPDLGMLRRSDRNVAALLEGSAAVQLFVSRAAAASGFVLDESMASPVAELCHRLDGLPLAIELAASRVGAFTPAELLAELSGRLDLISDGPRDVPASGRCTRPSRGVSRCSARRSRSCSPGSRCSRVAASPRPLTTSESLTSRWGKGWRGWWRWCTRTWSGPKPIRRTAPGTCCCRRSA
jgi:transcriptional regulator with XRE-family HTH domain